MSAEAVVASDATASATLAEDSQTPRDGRWDVAFTPYLWVAGMKGDIGIPRGDNEVEIDKSFADVVGSLKFAFMGTLDVRYDRFVALSDVMYISLGADAEGIRDAQFLEGRVNTSALVVAVAGGYRVVDRGPMFVDLVAGGRLVSLDAKVELRGPLTSRERKASKSNLEGLIGGRVRVPLGKNWGMAIYGDVGTGSVIWQMLGTVQWDISNHWRMAAGYRHMSINHKKDDFKFDVALSGPIVGVTYRF